MHYFPFQMPKKLGYDLNYTRRREIASNRALSDVEINALLSLAVKLWDRTCNFNYCFTHAKKKI